MKLKTTSDINQ